MHLFADHPVNVARRAAGKLPATNVWLWGLGSALQLTPFAELYGKRGAMVYGRRFAPRPCFVDRLEAD